MTVNALQPSIKFVRQQKYTQNDLMIDPLIVLRCDQRVHRYVSFEFHFYSGVILQSVSKKLKKFSLNVYLSVLAGD